ncbi:MAG: hypothetical protein WBV82_01955, partial [Myxococcaceae bacterium]
MRTNSYTQRSLRAVIASTALVLFPLSASAAAPRIALHRSEVVGDRSMLTDELHALVDAELVERGVQLAPAAEVKAFLATRRKRSCLALPEALRPACLSDLARTVGADRTLVITISPALKGKLLLSGLVVNKEGEVLQSLEPVEYPRPKKVRVAQALKEALPDFVGRLDVFKPLRSALVPGVAVGAPSADAAPGAEASIMATASTGDEHVRRRTFGIASLAAGAAVAGLGTWQLLASSAKYAEFEGAYANGGRPSPDQGDRLGELRGSADRARTFGAFGLGVGAAAIGTGLYLLLASPSSLDTPTSRTSILLGPS